MDSDKAKLKKFKEYLNGIKAEMEMKFIALIDLKIRNIMENLSL